MNVVKNNAEILLWDSKETDVEVNIEKTKCNGHDTKLK
jgi:hypothetical protein